MKDKIAKWYNSILPNGKRLWTQEMVKEAVDREVISSEDYEEITGQKYSEEGVK